MSPLPVRPFLVASLGALVLLSGCSTPNIGSRSYESHGARQVMEVQFGVVQATRIVQVEASNEGQTGGLTGAVIGGIAGSNIGGGRGQVVAGVLGAVAGGLAGQAIEKNVSRQDALEIIVRLDSGRTLAIVQGLDEAFSPGQRVRILSGGGSTRVAPDR